MRKGSAVYLLSLLEKSVKVDSFKTSDKMPSIEVSNKYKLGGGDMGLTSPKKHSFSRKTPSIEQSKDLLGRKGGGKSLAKNQIAGSKYSRSNMNLASPESSNLTNFEKSAYSSSTPSQEYDSRGKENSKMGGVAKNQVKGSSY